MTASSTRMLTCHRPAGSRLTVTEDGAHLRGMVLDHRIGRGSAIFASVSSLDSGFQVNADEANVAEPPSLLALNLG